MMDGMHWARLVARVALTAVVGLAVVIAPTAPASGRAGRGAGCPAPSGYTTVDLASLGFLPYHATFLNDRGMVAGIAVPEGLSRPHAVVWQRGELIDLTPEGLDGWVAGLNDRGEVLHLARDLSTGDLRMFLWRHGRSTEVELDVDAIQVYGLSERGQVLMDVGSLVLWRKGTVQPVAPPAGREVFLAPALLGDRGHVVGVQLPLSPGSDVRPAFIWKDGTFTDILIPSMSEIPTVTDVDRAGRVVLIDSSSTALWDDGSSVLLETLGGSTTWGFDTNDRGQVVGSSSLADGTLHAFLWEDGVMTDLRPVTGETSRGFAVNERGDVVGRVTDATGEDRVVVWSCGRELELGISSGMFQPHANIMPRAINDQGQVLTFVLTSEGDRMFLSTPVR